MDGKGSERFERWSSGAGQAGLSAGYHLKQAGPVVRDPRRERADRRFLA